MGGQNQKCLCADRKNQDFQKKFSQDFLWEHRFSFYSEMQLQYLKSPLYYVPPYLSYLDYTLRIYILTTSIKIAVRGL